MKFRTNDEADDGVQMIDLGDGRACLCKLEESQDTVWLEGDSVELSEVA